jgi:hypothetical protein
VDRAARAIFSVADPIRPAILAPIAGILETTDVGLDGTAGRAAGAILCGCRAASPDCHSGASCSAFGSCHCWIRQIDRAATIQLDRKPAPAGFPENLISQAPHQCPGGSRHTATSGPSESVGVNPQEAEFSSRYVAGFRLDPQYAVTSTAFSSHLA